MSSQEFPTYGRGDDDRGPDGQQQQQQQQQQPPTVPPAQPYGQGQYAAPQQYQYGGPPKQPYQQPYQQQPSQFGQYGPPQPYGPQQQFAPPPWQPNEQNHRIRQERGVEPNQLVSRLAAVGGAVAAFYGLLVLTVQRGALREIAQAPGSDLNHPLRTDIIDTIGQLAVAGLTGVVLALWIRDILERRKDGRTPVVMELVAFGFMAVALVFVLIWVFMIASTGFGSLDETTGRLPTAYGYGGLGLWMLAVGLFLVYRALRLDIYSVIDAGPARPPWEQ